MIFDLLNPKARILENNVKISDAPKIDCFGDINKPGSSVIYLYLLKRYVMIEGGGALSTSCSMVTACTKTTNIICMTLEMYDGLFDREATSVMRENVYKM